MNFIARFLQQFKREKTAALPTLPPLPAPTATPQTQYLIDVGRIEPLRLIAERQNRRPDELALAILSDVLKDYAGQEVNQLAWQKLSPREKQVAALICMQHTTPEIASLLHVKKSTVLTYVDHIFEKFDISNRKQLQARLAGWDFSKWIE